MGKETITFRVDTGTRKTLDVIAASIDRDRSYVLNEAIRSYLDLYRWQLAHIEEGIRQADAGQFVADAEVAATFAKLRKAKRA